MRIFAVLLFIFCLTFAPGSSAETAANVTVLRLPADALQPQAAIDSAGVIHLLYYKGELKHGDLYYVTRRLGKDEQFSQPIKVNSIEGSAIAQGGIRGGQLVIGKNKEIFVLWNSSKGDAIYFSRLNQGRDAFEPQLNLLREPTAIDGGGTIAADSKGNVFAFWHAVKEGQDESSGRIFMTVSKDNGKSFSHPLMIDSAAQGTCSCCSMRAFSDDKGKVFVLYRAAGRDINRDTTLLSSENGGKSFSSKKLEHWELNACPITLFALCPSSNGVVAGWETKGKVNFRNLNASASGVQTFGTAAKYPSIAAGKNGELLYSWTEYVTGDKGGEACWRLCDKTGKPIGKQESQIGVKRWSFTAALAQPDGGFVVIY